MPALVDRIETPSHLETYPKFLGGLELKHHRVMARGRIGIEQSALHRCWRILPAHANVQAWSDSQFQYSPYAKRVVMTKERTIIFPHGGIRGIIEPAPLPAYPNRSGAATHQSHNLMRAAEDVKWPRVHLPTLPMWQCVGVDKRSVYGRIDIGCLVGRRIRCTDIHHSAMLQSRCIGHKGRVHDTI